MTVLEVTADAVRLLSSGGRSPVDPALVEAALDWADEPVGLYEDRPVSVAEMWRAIMVAAAGDSCERMVLVHPDDWPRPRIERIVAAANAVADDVVATPRSAWRPTEVPPRAAGPERQRRRVRPRAVIAPAVLVVGTLAVLGAGAAVIGSARPAPTRHAAVKTVEEGRIAVQVPADWTVERVTGGPGSRRLQATSPSDADVAVHVTQSYAPESTLGQAADVLARAIAQQPAGVFVDLRPDARYGGRAAVYYREIRPGRFVDWWIVVAGATRVSVGCQSEPGAGQAVRAACEQAVGSVHERGTDQAPAAS